VAAALARASGGGQGLVDVGLAGAGLFDDLRRGQAEQAQLLDRGDLVGGGQPGAVFVFVPFADDAGCLVGGDDDPDVGAADLDGGQGAAASVTHGQRAVLGAHRNDRHQHAEVADAGEEVLSSAASLRMLTSTSRVVGSICSTLSC
jgi:hypothetical protein